MLETYITWFDSRIKLLSLLLCTLMMSALAGCAAPQAKPEPVFFPPPPNPPRVHFLKSISTAADVEKEETGFWSVIGLAEKVQVKPIIKPYGISMHKGVLYVADVQAGTVVIIDPANGKFDYLKGDLNYGKLKKPVNVVVDDEGAIYVADTARKEVLMYDAAGAFVKTYGKGITKKPVDVALFRENIYILDLGDNNIKVIDKKSGDLVKSIGRPEEGKAEEGKYLSIPTNFMIDKKGEVYVTNVGNGSVSKLDVDGHFISSFGKLGDAFGEFTRPKGVAVDGQGRIYIVDGGNQNVQIFSEAQRLLIFFGTPPLKRGALNLPTGIAVSTDNLDYYQKLAAPGFIVEQVIFVANQMGDSKISIYGLGHKEGQAPAEEKPKQ